MISNVLTSKCNRENFNFNQESHIFLQVPSIDYSRSMGDHQGNFSLLKG